METTFDSTADPGARLESAKAGAREIKTAAAEEIKSLIADVEDLVARIADLNDGDVARVRSKVMQAVGVAKDSLAEGTDTLKRRTREVLGDADGYVRENPWAAIGLAALVGAVAGILVARRS